MGLARATDLLRKVRHRTRRRRALVPSLAVLGAAGVLAVAVATLTVTMTPPASAQERVAAAVTLTALDGRVYVQLPSGVAGRQSGLPERARWFLRTAPTRTTPASPTWPTSAGGRCSARSGALELAQSASDVREVGPVSGDGRAGTRFASP